MGIGYQQVDKHSFDYELWYLPGINIPLRGPCNFDRATAYIAFTGAAQTFGRFASKPFPEQVASFFSVNHINLGISGAGCEAYFEKQALMDYINKSCLAVIQLTSGRSLSAGYFEAQKNKGVLKFIQGPLVGKEYLAQQAFQKLGREYGRKCFIEQVAAAREMWIIQFKKFLNSISVPKLLLWVSIEDLSSRCHQELNLQNFSLGEFPHFVTTEMIGQIRPFCNGLIDASYPMLPQVIRNKWNGEIYDIFNSEKFPNRPEWSRCLNTYYPSQNMHDYIASQIIKYFIDEELISTFSYDDISVK